MAIQKILSGWTMAVVALSANCGGRAVEGDAASRAGGGSTSKDGTGGASEIASGGSESPSSGANGGQLGGSDGGSGSGAMGGASSSGGQAAGGRNSGGASIETGGEGGSAPGGGGSGGTFGGSFCVGQTFDADPTEGLDCKPWTVCEAGSRQLQSPDHARDRICEECPDGTFTEWVNKWTCEEWSLCSLGEVDAEPLTNKKDRSCRPGDTFPRVEGALGKLVVTEEGLYAPHSPTYSGELNLIYSTLEGTSTSTLLVEGTEEGVASGASSSDIAHLGDAVYIAGSKWKLDAAGENTTYSGFLIKADAEGQVVWEKSIGESGDRPSDLLIATAGANISIIELTGPEQNPLDLPTENEVVLRTYDEDGELVDTTIIEESSTMGSLSFYERGENQHHYLVLVRGVEPTPALCAELESSYDYDFSYYCDFGMGLGRSALLELDETGALVAEYPLGYLGPESVKALELDAAGTVFVFTEGYALHRLEEGGSELLTTRWEREELLDVLAVTADALLFAGRDDDRSALFTMAKTGPPILTRDILPDYNPAYFTSIEVAPDGTVFVAGSDFIIPWPK